MAIKDICRRGQKVRSVPMENDHFRNRTDHGDGWESNQSLLTNMLSNRTSHRTGATGFKDSLDQIRLTEAWRQ